MKRLLLTGLLMVTALRLATAQLLTPDQLRADLRYVQQVLNEAHPAPYTYTTQATFDSLVAAVSAQLNQPMSRPDFYRTMVPLVAALRDGHLKWLMPGQDEHYPLDTTHLFPLRLYVLGQRAWLVANYGDEPVRTGDEVTAINGQPMATLLQTLLPRITFADGLTDGGKYSDLNQFFSGYYATFIATPDQFAVTLTTPAGPETHRFQPVRLQQIRHYETAHAVSRPPFELAFLADSVTALLTIRQFVAEPGQPKPKRFLSDVFHQLQLHHVHGLLLDLRDNEGGDEAFGIRLYSYLISQPQPYYDHVSVRQKAPFSFPARTPRLYRLARLLAVKRQGDGYYWRWHPGLKPVKPQRDAFTGPVVLLLNGRSFSTTTELAARLRSRPQTTVVGQETAGGYRGNNSGFFAVTTLPNTKVELGIPLLGFQMAGTDQTFPTNRGILPDYSVVPAITDVLTGYDPAMAQALQRIQRDTPASVLKAH